MLYLLVTGRISLRLIVTSGAAFGLGVLALTVPIDSYFWQKIPLWPELAGFYFNAVLGSSAEWGVSPWHYYFTSALPRLLLNPLAMPLIGFALTQPGISSRTRDLVIPNILFVAIYSIQPHKEARFIFYVVPSLTAAAALGASFIVTRRSKSALYTLATTGFVLSILGSFAISSGMLLISSLNYPGGDALSSLHALTRQDNLTDLAFDVHADVLTCMTGLTLFGQNPAGLPLAFGLPSKEVLLEQGSPPVLMFDKTEKKLQLVRPIFWLQFDYALTEDPSTALGGKWNTLGVVHGYDGIEILKPGSAPPAEPKHTVLGRGAVVERVKNAVMPLTGGW
ncbi:hypothetical protein Golomagni_08044, partial [Golovinomyces magnicellulatus]